MSESVEGLVKIYIDLPDESRTGGESFWAKPVGPELFELRNSPWYAYELNLGDVVRAVAESPDHKPKILKLVRPSGHKTLRVIFPKSSSESDQVAILATLEPFGASYERAYAHFVAIDVLPTGDYQRVCDMLWELEKRGQLSYETGSR